MAAIENPVLRGFNPDPSFVRVGDDYYLATSTFEWWPGVALYHSRDLANWRPVGHALTRESQLNLRGVVDSGGVWAPSLSYADGLFWLIYTNVRTCGLGRPFKDVGVFLTTSPSIDGPWTDPIKLDGIGFDPSLFHDHDGRKWLVNMMWDFRPGKNRFAGIVVQEYRHDLGELVGPRNKILGKDVLTEGPNLYQRDGWYYLMLAEGGTGWNHGISMARSRSLLGPYELDPQAAVLTTRDCPDHPLQKAGHGELVQTAGGEWYLAHLASRPVGEGADRRCMLGRETCLQAVVWDEAGWLRLAGGGTRPALRVPLPKGVGVLAPDGEPARDEFDRNALGPSWSSLRGPMEASWCSLAERPGWLRLRGRESLHSRFEQSLVARRVTEHDWVATTRLEFSPDHFTQSAGLIVYYNTAKHAYLRVTHHETRGRILGVVVTDDGRYDELDGDLDVGDWPTCNLRAEIRDGRLQFSASRDLDCWLSVGPEMDATKQSDDYGNGLHFTGAMIGLCAQDLGGTGRSADFDWFESASATES